MSIKAGERTEIFSCRAWRGSKQKEKEKKEERKAKEKPLSFSLRSHLIATSALISCSCSSGAIENRWYVLLFIVVFHLRDNFVVNITCIDSLLNSL